MILYFIPIVYIRSFIAVSEMRCFRTYVGTTGHMTDCCRDDNTVSVIDGKNNTKIEDIPVGEGPSAIAVDIFRNKTYVANKDGNNISVIDAKNNTRLRDIPVAEYYDNIKGSESGA